MNGKQLTPSTSSRMSGNLIFVSKIERNMNKGYHLCLNQIFTLSTKMMEVDKPKTSHVLFHYNSIILALGKCKRTTAFPSLKRMIYVMLPKLISYDSQALQLKPIF